MISVHKSPPIPAASDSPSAVSNSGVIFLKVIFGGDLADIQLVMNVCLMQLASFFWETFYMSLHRILRCLS